MHSLHTTDKSTYSLDEVLLEYLYEWTVSSNYPFEVNRETKTKFDPYSIQEKMNINAFYGAYNTNSYYNSRSEKSYYNYNYEKLRWRYMTNANTNVDTDKCSKTYKEEDTALCVQKELLIEHYSLKIKKLSKSKKKGARTKIKEMQEIIDKLTKEVNEYLDAYPERFI